MSQEQTNTPDARNYGCFELRSWSELKEGMVVSAQVSLPHDRNERKRFPSQVQQDILKDPRDAIMLPKSRPVVIAKIVRSIGTSPAHDHAICWPVTSLWKTMKKKDFDDACTLNGRPPQAYYPIGNVEPSGDWPYPPIMPEAPNRRSGFVDLWTPITISWNNLIGRGRGSTRITSTALQLLRDAAPDFYHNPHLSFESTSGISSDGQSSPTPVLIHGATISFAAYNAAQEIAEAMDLACDLKRRMLERSVTGSEMLWELGGVIDVLSRLQQKAPPVTLPGSPATNSTSTAPRPKPPTQRASCNDPLQHQTPPRGGGGPGGGGGGSSAGGSGSRNDNTPQAPTSRYRKWRGTRSNTVSNSSNTGNQCTWNPDHTISFRDEKYYTSHLNLHDSLEYDACSYASAGWFHGNEWASEPEPDPSPALLAIDTRHVGFVPDEVPEIPNWVMGTKITADDYNPAERDQYWKNEFRTVSVVAVWISRLMARTRRNSIANYKAASTDASEDGESCEEDVGENSAARGLASDTEWEEERDEDGSTVGSQITGWHDEATESEDNEATPSNQTAEWAGQAASTVVVAESEEQQYSHSFTRSQSVSDVSAEDSPSFTDSQSVSDVSVEKLEESTWTASTTAKMPSPDAALLFAAGSEWGEPCPLTSTQGWSTQGRSTHVASAIPTIAGVLAEAPISHTTTEARSKDEFFPEYDIGDDPPSNTSNFEALEHLLKDKHEPTTTIRALPDPSDPDIGKVYKQNLWPRFSLSRRSRILTSPPPASPVLKPQAQSLTHHNLLSSAHLPFNDKTLEPWPPYIRGGFDYRRHVRTYTRFGAGSTHSEILTGRLVTMGSGEKRASKCVSEPPWEGTGEVRFRSVELRVSDFREVAARWDRAEVVEISRRGT